MPTGPTVEVMTPKVYVIILPLPLVSPAITGICREG
jgi:hypothetical protein